MDSPAPRRTSARTGRSACSTPTSAIGTCTRTWPTLPAVAVTRISPYKTLPELLDAMKAKPGQITAATAGVTSAGTRHGGDLARDRRQVPARHLRRRHPAVAATVAGETRGDDPARVEAGRDDPREAPAAARLGERQAGYRGLQHHRADHEVGAGLRHRPTTSASSSGVPPRSSRRSTRRAGTIAITRRWVEVRYQRGAVFAPVAAGRSPRCGRVQANARCCTRAADQCFGDPVAYPEAS